MGLATGEAHEEPTEDSGKNPHAVALGRLGGLKGGRPVPPNFRLSDAKRLHERLRRLNGNLGIDKRDLHVIFRWGGSYLKRFNFLEIFDVARN